MKKTQFANPYRESDYKIFQTLFKGKIDFSKFKIVLVDEEWKTEN